ncbi:hypothetical protein EDF56_106320 [Novosphingobium sp. PhB165]|uniref:hypothetical protein n=1 Tax=Novosphingobium sp. PhB165 TaxID=2485105 RepID=UPI00104515EE|nr:hypothetical protein [Novosphingobium sp. PhB165]TCM17204.1 hypothetical protein EDF56_106320 [Novosphingobium sp. PhB165]
MAAITLPDTAIPNDATVLLRDFGTVLTPFLGGPEQRINRPGTRFAMSVVLPNKRTQDDALKIQSRLLRAREDRLLMEFWQPGFDPGDPGAPVVSAAVNSGSSLPLSGLRAGYVIKEGQFASIIHAGRRYVYMFAADFVAGAGGAVLATIWPMLRTPLSAGDVVEIKKPMIEGLVNPGDELSWQISVDCMRAFNFKISEGA